jgi:hypothetical protein
MPKAKAKSVCQFEDCRSRAVYAFSGEYPRLCKTHREDGMVDMKTKKCIHPGCTTSAGFGKPRQYCKKHAPEGEKVHRKLCTEAGCSTAPSWKSVGGGVASHCAKHKKSGMVLSCATQSCQSAGCLKHATYGSESDMRPVSCRVHAGSEMVDVKNRKCTAFGCATQPGFNFPGERPAYCKNHSVAGMIDVRSIFCCTPHCTTRASYALRGELRPVWCAAHRPEDEDMEDVVNRVRVGANSTRMGVWWMW